MSRRFPAFLIFGVILFCPVLLALNIPPRPEGRVSDYAGMLSQAKQAELEEKLRRFEEETSNQIVVVTFPRLDGEVLDDFSMRLAEAWKIGRKGKDNGIILLVFKEDRTVRIEVGYGLEGALPDATAKLIIENEIVPRFREGRFDEGIEVAVHAIHSATKGEYQAGVPAGSLELEDWQFVLILPLLLGLMIAVIAFASRSQNKKGRKTSRGRRDEDQDYGTGGRPSGDSGGGFGGGGGSFGGGGASGRW